MTKPQFKIHGEERRQMKKELSLLKRSLKDYWFHWGISNDLYEVYDSQNFINEKDAVILYDAKEYEIKRLEQLLEEPYTN